MSTKGLVFYPSLGPLFSYTHAFLGAHSQPTPAASNQRRTTRTRAASPLSADVPPPAQRVARRRVQHQPFPANSRLPLPHLPRLVGSVAKPRPTATQKLRARGVRRQQGGRRRSAPGAQRQPRAKRARHQRGDAGEGQQTGRRSRGRGERGACAEPTAAAIRSAVTAAGEWSTAPARGRRRGATDGETQPRARGVRRLRGADGGGQQTRGCSCGRRERSASSGATAMGNNLTDAAAGDGSAAPALG